MGTLILPRKPAYLPNVPDHMIIRESGGDNDIQPAPDQNPERSDCPECAIDPDTNKPVCLD